MASTLKRRPICRSSSMLRDAIFVVAVLGFMFYCLTYLQPIIAAAMIVP